MGVNILEFCTPPVPGQAHKYYGNGHNNFIKLPVTVLSNKVTKVTATTTTATTTTTASSIPPNASLHTIATGGNLTLMKHILPLLPAEAVDEPHSATGLTPLHFAASRGHFEMVKYLVDDYGATIDAKDKEGETCLLKAAYNGHFHIVKYLVSKNTNIHLKDKDGWTSLHNACARGYLAIVRLLVEQGARVDVRSKMGHTPLINAASKGHISIVEYLISKAHANPLIKNSFGEAAYDVSAAAGESYICDMLYKAGQTWWAMQQQHASLTAENATYNLLDFHVTVMVALHENERSSSLLGLSRPQFSAASLSKHDGRGHWSLYPSGQPTTKDQVQLPLNNKNNNAGGNSSSSTSDWFWLTDWQIDYSDPRIDPTSGWQYARSFEDPDEAWTPVTPTNGYGWVRRRRWVRVMKRRMDLLKGSHVGGQAVDEMEDYLNDAEEIVLNSKLELDDSNTSIQQLTLELRALEEAVQLLRAGVKKDGNQFRIHQANTLATSYTKQIDTLNTKIAQLAPTVSTPITSTTVQHNAELARELGFNVSRKETHQQQQQQQEETTTTTNDFDANPWSRDTATDWQISNIMSSSSLNHVDLIGHGMEDPYQQQQDEVEEEEEDSDRTGARKYTWESDVDVKTCRECDRRFGFLVRRHHCRYCGLIVCDRCSMSRAYLSPSQIVQDPNGLIESPDVLASHHQRVCDTCYAKLGVAS